MKKEMKRNNNLLEPKNLLIGFLLIIVFLLGFNYYSLLSQRNVNLKNLDGELYSTILTTSPSPILYPPSLINIGDDSIVPPISDNNWCNGADIDRDRDVDVDDRIIWENCVVDSTNPECKNADINKDGNVDELDFTILEKNFGRDDCTGDSNLGGDDCPVDSSNCPDECDPFCSIGCTESNWCNGADINRDGNVDNADVELWSQYEGCVVSPDSDCGNADINNDGTVDQGDYEILEINLGKTNCAEDVQCIPNPETAGKSCPKDYLSLLGNSELKVPPSSVVIINGICGGNTGELPGECVIPGITCDPETDPSCKPPEPDWCNYITCPHPFKCISPSDNPREPYLCAGNPIDVVVPEPEPCKKKCPKDVPICYRMFQGPEICTCLGCPGPHSPKPPIPRSE